MEGRILGRMRRYLSTASWYFVSYLINEAAEFRLTYGWELIDGDSVLGEDGEEKHAPTLFEIVRIT
jgi:hypothetical protein